MRATVVCACAVLMLFTQARVGQAQPTGGMDVKIGTLGIGFDGAVGVNEKSSVRVGVNFFTYNHDFDNDGITLAAHLKLRSVMAQYDAIAPTATAASKALPPRSSICRPADDAIGWPVVTSPCRPATAGRVDARRSALDDPGGARRRLLTLAEGDVESRWKRVPAEQHQLPQRRDRAAAAGGRP